MTHRTSSLAFLTVAALTLSACHKQKPVEPPAPVPTPSQPTRTSTPETARPTPPATDPGAEARAKAARDAAAIAAIKTSLTAPIFFDYDRAELRDDARAALDAKAPALRANPAVRIRVAGHTDERGSAEYNMALGQKRAAAARRYLVGLGIAESRIDIVSYGEERPAIGGEGEGSWSKNRRDEFEIVAGADQIRAPGA